MHRLVRRLCVVLFAISILAGCSSDPETVVYEAPLAADAPAATDITPDGTVVPAGEWGVVKRVDSDKVESVYAIKPTAVVRGKKGDFSDVMGVGTGDLDAMTPYHVSWTWVTLQGDANYDPNLVSADPNFTSLSVPPSLQRCDPAAAHDYNEGVGHVQRGCTVLTALAGSPLAIAFVGVAGSSKEVTFTLPKTG